MKKGVEVFCFWNGSGKLQEDLAARFVERFKAVNKVLSSMMTANLRNHVVGKNGFC